MQTADILVVGGGVVALAITARLAARRHRVMLVNDATPGASLAAAGMLAPSFEAQHHRAMGNQRHLFAALERWDGFADWCLRQSRMPIDYRRDGIVGLDLDIGGFPGGREVAVPDGVRAATALEVPREGQVDPRRLHNALRAIVTALKVPTVAGTATAVHPASGKGSVSRITLADGAAMEASRIIVAAGHRSPALHPALPPLTEMRGRAFLVRGMSHRLPRVWRTADLYFCPKADGSIYVGATEEQGAPGGDLDALWSRAVAVLPALGDVKPAAVFDGIRPAAPGGRPLIGPVPALPGVITAYGHDRNGVLLTPWTADEVETVLGRS